MEEVFDTKELSVERKRFYFDLKKNGRGAFLRITEDVNGRRDTIIVPATGLQDFARAVSELAQLCDSVNAKA